MFRPLLWAIFRSQKYLFEETIQYVIKYITLKLNDISLLFSILIPFRNNNEISFSFRLIYFMTYTV